MTVDVHAHAVPPPVVAWLGREGSRLGVRVEKEPGGRVHFQHREGYRYPVGPEFTSAETVLAQMDRARVGHRILSLPPTLFLYGQPPEAAQAACSAFNDALVEFVQAGPQRLSAMITVPLQDPERAALEVERLAGHPAVRAVEIGTNVEEQPLDAPSLDPFFSACERAGLPLFLHPYYVGPKPRLEPYYLTNSLGNPLDTTVAAARLVHGGVLERHPGLRVLLAHGGGFFPYQLGRLDHSFRVRPEPKEVCSKPPTAFLGQLYFDSVLHFPKALRYLVEAVGPDHVLLGSDYPFDMADPEPVASVERAGLDEAARRAVLGQSAAGLFGLAA